MELARRVSKNFSELSPQLKLAARFVLDHPDEVATRSLRTLASQSGLSAPTYSRLARAIGYDAYDDLRDICREELKQKQLTLAQRASLLRSNERLVSANGRDTFAERHAAVAASNLSSMLEDLDVAELADVSERLARAKKVKLAGSLSSRSMVDYLAHIAGLATANWSVVGQEGPSIPAELADMNEETVLLSVSVAPYLRRTVQIAEKAADAGAVIVAITDDIQAPILKHATHSFVVQTDSLNFFPSHIAILTLLEIIGGMVVSRLGPEANERIDKVERLSRSVGDYVD